MGLIAWWPTLIVLTVATAYDIRSRRIPNWLVVPFFFAGVFTASVTHGWYGFAQSLLGILLAALVMGTLYLLGGMGMGDVKLCAAIGAWIGPAQLLMALVVTGMIGGVLALVWALRDPLARKIPYAPAIAVGTIFSFLSLS